MGIDGDLFNYYGNGCGERFFTMEMYIFGLISLFFQRKNSEKNGEQKAFCSPSKKQKQKKNKLLWIRIQQK